MNIGKFIYSKKKDKRHVTLTIFGIKFKYRNPNTSELILSGVKRLIATANLHRETFADFRNKYKGKTIALFGAGPSLNNFDPDLIKADICVALNRTFAYDKVKFDYLFAIDKVGIDQWYDKFFAYRPDECIKFLGDQNLGPKMQIPESLIFGSNVRRYKTTAGYLDSEFSHDIESEPLGNFNTVSLQAIQFILYTNPAKVYLVGIDCSQGVHFAGKSPDIKKIMNENPTKMQKTTLKSWLKLKEFASTYYPGTEIISVNPVGLRGMFNKDVYTQSYINEHPELLDEKIEIIKNEKN